MKADRCKTKNQSSGEESDENYKKESDKLKKHLNLKSRFELANMLIDEMDHKNHAYDFILKNGLIQDFMRFIDSSKPKM